MKPTVKNLLALVAVLFLSNAAFSQDNTRFWNPKKYSGKDAPRIYVNFGPSVFNHFLNGEEKSIKTGFNFTHFGVHLEHNNFGISFQRNSFTGRARQLPDDFIPTTAILDNNVKAYPVDFLHENTFTLKWLSYTNKKWLHFSVEAGVASGKYLISQNFAPKQHSPSGILNSSGENYTYDQVKKSFIGLHLKAGANLPIFRAFGLSANILSTIASKEASYIGLETNVTIGYLRKK